MFVKVNESVYLPKAANVYEIFPYNLGADCSTIGYIKYDLEKEFPVHSEIRVIAKEATLLTEQIRDGSVRLEDRPGDGGIIVSNLDEKGNKMTSVSSVFDYKSFRCTGWSIN